MRIEKSTRKDDLDHLDQARFNRKEEKSPDHVRAMLAAVYEQIQDPYLERKRQELIDCLKQLDEKQDMLVLQKYWQIQEDVMSYGKRPDVRKKIAERIAKEASHKEADIYMEGR